MRPIRISPGMGGSIDKNDYTSGWSYPQIFQESPRYWQQFIIFSILLSYVYILWEIKIQKTKIILITLLCLTSPTTWLLPEGTNFNLAVGLLVFIATAVDRTKIRILGLCSLLLATLIYPCSLPVLFIFTLLNFRRVRIRILTLLALIFIGLYLFILLLREDSSSSATLPTFGINLSRIYAQEFSFPHLDHLVIHSDSLYFISGLVLMFLFAILFLKFEMQPRLLISEFSRKSGVSMTLYFGILYVFSFLDGASDNGRMGFLAMTVPFGFLVFVENRLFSIFVLSSFISLWMSDLNFTLDGGYLFLLQVINYICVLVSLTSLAKLLMRLTKYELAGSKGI